MSVDAVYRDKAFSNFQAALAIFGNASLSAASFYSKELKEIIDQRLRSEKFDRIIVFSSVMAEYVKNVKHIAKVMDFVDVDSEKWRVYADYHPFPFSQIYRLEAKRLAQYEEEVAKLFDHSIFVSEKEAKLFQKRVKDRPISVIPNGVDMAYFAQSKDTGNSISQPPVIIFTGAMDYFPNVDAVKYFCEEIFPSIRQAMPEVGFYIVGRNPTRQVIALGRQPRVIVTGSVPDIRPYLAKARVAVAPFRLARGIQNKVLEAMAMGVPVVGTSNGFQGTQATITDGIRIADDPVRFAQDVLALLSNSDLRQKCSIGAQRYVERCHRWEDHCARLESLLHQLS